MPRALASASVAHIQRMARALLTNANPTTLNAVERIIAQKFRLREHEHPPQLKPPYVITWRPLESTPVIIFIAVHPQQQDHHHHHHPHPFLTDDENCDDSDPMGMTTLFMCASSSGSPNDCFHAQHKTYDTKIFFVVRTCIVFYMRAPCADGTR